ncbi:MAG: lysozyme [Zoogloeaceae bacterium]|jgi:lysozyme|nr:lysozyme [Zoogloeaceae bacterium]
MSQKFILPSRLLPWPICWPGVVLIAESEACRLVVYKDIAGHWTLGWGQTAGITEGMTWTQTEADADLCNTLITLSAEVRECLTRDASDNEFAALVSLAYNIGMTAFRRSTVAKCHNRGDKTAAARAFHLWNKAGGKVINGLVARRAREAALYLSEDRGQKTEDSQLPALRAANQQSSVLSPLSSEPGQSPDADPVKPLAKSPTVQTGAASVATGGLALAAQYSPQVGQVARSLAISPLVVAAIVAIVVGALVIWRRVQQRKGGVA